ncbi:thiamine diphosphokinase [Candidatus Woesearchaeota archaeon]|nr:thiamine diphosphokinase [Candidatus Woesearchaeota archaeon]
MKIGIIANGEFDDSVTECNSDILICADGGANHAHKMRIVPQYIIGDLDSIKSDVLEYYKHQDVKIIDDKDQSRTDTELALSLALTFKPSQITLFCANGTRTDHFLANIITLSRYVSENNSKPQTTDGGIRLRMVDKNSTIHIVNRLIKLTNIKGKTISVIPLEPVKGLSYTGLKWNVNNLDTESGWFGVSNLATEDICRIDMKSGKVMIIIPNTISDAILNNSTMHQNIISDDCDRTDESKNSRLV